MILHAIIVDDEEDVLESLTPGFVNDFARRLAGSDAFQRANEAAGSPLPRSGRLNVAVSASGYQGVKVQKSPWRSPTHVRLHLCCEKGGSFRHALRILKEQFCAVVVSDLRFADDALGARAGRYFIEDVQRRNPETFGVLYSAYPKPDGFPADRFVRKGAATNLAGEQLIDKMVEGFTQCLNVPRMRRLALELGQRGILYQSDAFGAVLRRMYDLASAHFGREWAPDGRRRPRPTVLIDGETGTGKTELAALLHRISDRGDQPFVSATCVQWTNETFLRSTLFGHRKGAFSGATADRPGLVATAGKGTLLLDDLHAIREDCSLILHSFLDDGVYSHLGEDEVRRDAHAGVLCTVETPRWEEIKANQSLPESFLQRVEQMILRVPPLRQRPEDVERQAATYCATFSRELGAEMELSPDAIAWLLDYGFPGGNSRKLRNFVKGLVAENARVTDYLDVPEVEEYAREAGLVGRDPAPRGPAASPPPPTTTEPAPSAPAAPSDTGWRQRIHRLAAKAIEEECSLPPESAAALASEFFDRAFAKLWTDFLAITRSAPLPAPMEVKLFDELFRYYAIYAFGSPARAAKELGMKDNALREFVYSRELRRDVVERPASQDSPGSDR